jgi:chaperonin GroEL (HSP60 family)
VVPKTLADNSGLDTQDVLIKLEVYSHSPLHNLFSHAEQNVV